MRVLLLDEFRDVVGGAQTYEKALVSELRRRGHDVALLHQCPFTPGSESIDGTDPEHARWSVDALGRERAFREVKAWKPDVVYVNGLNEMESALLDAYPSVFYAHDYRGTCVTGQKHHSRPRSSVCERRLGPACFPINFAYGCGGVNPARFVQSYLLRQGHLAGLHRYGAVLVASHHMVREFERHDVPAIRLPPFGRVPPVDTLGPPNRSGVVLFASRLTALKGGTRIVGAVREASKRLGRELTLVVAGDGAERAPMERRARAEGVRARFLGWVGFDGVAEAMRGAEVLAVSSVWPEPFALVGIEAGGLGVPTAGYAVGGIPDWLIAGESGESASSDPPTEEGLGAAIARVLADPAHYAKLREGAWRVAKSFSRDAHVQGLEGVFAGVASTYGRP